MLHSSKMKALTRLIIGLFSIKKPNITRVNHRNLYFKNYYFPENLCKGIDIITHIERTSKIRTAAKLMEAGISSYILEKIKEQIDLDHAAMERNEKMKRTRFAFIMRKIARQNGYYISKFI